MPRWLRLEGALTRRAFELSSSLWIASALARMAPADWSGCRDCSLEANHAKMASLGGYAGAQGIRTAFESLYRFRAGARGSIEDGAGD